MHQKPVLSICIPAYNRPVGLKKALESIVSQPDFDSEIEVLIIDDASSANLKEIVKPHELKYKNVRFIRNKSNFGFERNILKLLENFAGSYFFFLSDDDELLPKALEKIKKIIKRNSEVGFFSSDRQDVFVQQGRIYIHQTFSYSQKISKNQIEKIVKIYWDSHAFSRICLKRQAVNLEGYKRHLGSMYPHMFLVGFAGLNFGAYYLAEPLIKHTAENPVFWKYPAHFMVEGRIKIIADLGEINKDFYSKAFDLEIKRIANIIYPKLIKNFSKFKNFLVSLTKIPQIRFNLLIWAKILAQVSKLFFIGTTHNLVKLIRKF